MRTVSLMLLGAAALLEAGRWEIQLFHDEDKSALALADIAFPSAARGLAVGVLAEGRSRRPVTLVTSDGGARWTYHRAPDAGRSLFCLEESACWMAAETGVWFSGEGGRDWRRVFKQRGIARVWFASRERGWAIGAEKKLFETRDAGRTWTALAVRDGIKSSVERTVFHAIAFAGQAGMIAGRSEPVDRSEFPIWMDNSAERRRERPTLTVYLETRNGGATWHPMSASLFGRVSQLQIGSDGRALALFEFDRYFRYPSEIHRIDLRTGRSGSAFRREDTALTDIALTAGGTAFAAGYEPPGKLARTPIPGKLKVLSSRDFEHWEPMEADYRAVARRVTIAAVDEANAWLATDTGMILRWNEHKR